VARGKRSTASPDVQAAALLHRARLAARSGERARAVRYYAAVIELDPNIEEAWLERAALLDDPQNGLPSSMIPRRCWLTWPAP